MMRTTIAVVAGVTACFLLIMAIEAGSHTIWPTPNGLNPDDPNGWANYVSKMALGAKLAVVLAWCMGGLMGCAIAVRISIAHKGIAALTVGAVLGLATITNFATIPHPAWMIFAAAIGIPVAAWLGWYLNRNDRAAAKANPGN
jgi:hypothetical protein